MAANSQEHVGRSTTFGSTIRTLRIATACSCFVLLLGFLTVYGRSYLARETVQGPCIAVFSWRGQIAISIDPKRTNAILHTASWPDSSLQLFPDGQLAAFGNRATWPPVPSPIGFSYSHRPDSYRFTFPHWALALVLAATAVASKPPPRLRVSLRELLLVMLIAGVLMGCITALVRARHKSFDGRFTQIRSESSTRFVLRA